jgi:hypothetical protein
VLPQQKLSRKNRDSDREVFRSAGSIVLSWAWFVVAVITLIDLAIQGRDHDAAITAVLVAAISAVVYVCAWRPCIVADSAGITVANPLRDHHVPWAAVANVDVVHTVRVHTTPAPGADKGKILYSWAVQTSPSSARRAARRAGLMGQRPRMTRPPRSIRTSPPPGAEPGYGRMPDSARESLDRTSAEFTVGRLNERTQHARAAIAGKALANADQQAAAEPSDTAPETAGAAAERPVATWAWGPIAAMLASIALLIIVILV